MFVKSSYRRLRCPGRFGIEDTASSLKPLLSLGSEGRDRHRDRGMDLMTLQGPSWPLKAVDPVPEWVMPWGRGEARWVGVGNEI